MASLGSSGEMDALRISSGILVWGAHFAVLYGFTALACARGFPGAIPWVAGAATVVALGAAAFVLAISIPHRARFVPWLSGAIAAVAAVAIAFEGLALAMVPACR